MQSAMKRTGLNERCGKSKSYDTFATIIPQSKNDCYIIVPRARHPIVIKVTAMDSLSVTGYALRIEKRRDGNFEEFYSHPAKASELKVHQVRGLIRKKKWNKNEIKNAKGLSTLIPLGFFDSFEGCFQRWKPRKT